MTAASATARRREAQIDPLPKLPSGEKVGCTRTSIRSCSNDARTTSRIATTSPAAQSELAPDRKDVVGRAGLVKRGAHGFLLRYGQEKHAAPQSEARKPHDAATPAHAV